MRSSEEYFDLKVESYIPDKLSGLHGPVHIKPCANQEDVDTTLHVECSKKMSRDYPVGSKFIIRAKLTNKEGKGWFYYTSYQWPFKHIKE